MVQNKRRIEVSTSNPGISHNYIDVDFLDDTVVNVHGYRAILGIEPEDGGANANGMMAVWVLPGGVIQNGDLPATYGSFGDEKYSPYLWAMIPWVASNESPARIEFAPKSTRNMQRGGRIVLHIYIQGISAGMVRLNTVQTMFTSQVK